MVAAWGRLPMWFRCFAGRATSRHDSVNCRKVLLLKREDFVPEALRCRLRFDEPLSSRSFFDGLFRAPFDGFVSATGDQFAGRMRFSGSLVLRKVKGGYLSKEMDWLRMPVRYSRKRRCPILDCRCARRRWFCAGRDGTMPDRTKDATSHFRFPHAVEASGSGSAN